MAVVAIDSDVHPRFWGGREALALALGKVWPTGDSDDARRGRQSIERSLKHSLRTLRQAGAITLEHSGHVGEKSCYGLNLKPSGSALNLPSDDLWKTLLGAESGGQPVSPSGGQPVSPSGGQPVSPSGGQPVSPLGVVQEDVGLSSGLGGEDDHGPAPSARARGAAKRSSAGAWESGGSKPECATCGTALDPDGSCFVCG